MIILIFTLMIKNKNIVRKNICNNCTPVKELLPIKQYQDLDNNLIKPLILRKIERSLVYTDELI